MLPLPLSGSGKSRSIAASSSNLPRAEVTSPPSHASTGVPSRRAFSSRTRDGSLGFIGISLRRHRTGDYLSQHKMRSQSRCLDNRVADLERIRWTGALLKSLLFRTEATEPQTLVAVATVPAVAL